MKRRVLLTSNLLYSKFRSVLRETVFKMLVSANPMVKRDLVRILGKLLCFNQEQRVRLGLDGAVGESVEFDHGLADLWVTYLLSQKVEN